MSTSSATLATLPADAAASADVAAAEISLQLGDVPSLPQRTTTTRRKHITTKTDDSSSSSIEVVESTLVAESENKGDGVVADTPVVDNTVAYLNALKEVRAFMHEGGVVAEDVDQFDIKEEHGADCMAKWHPAAAITSAVATTATNEISTPWVGVRLRDPYKGTLLPISTCIASYLHALAHALTDEHQHTHSPLSSSSSDHSSDSSNELSPRAPSPSDLTSHEHKEDEDEEERGENEAEDESDHEDETSTSQFKADKAPQKGQRKGKDKAKGKSKKKHKTKTGFRYDEEHEDAELPRDTRGHERREKSAARKRRDSDTAAATGDRAHSHRFYKIFCSLLREAEKHGALVLTGNHAKLTRRVVTRFDSIDTEDFVSALGLPPLSSPKYDAVLCPPDPEPTPTVPVAAAAIASSSVPPAAPSKRAEAPLTNNPKMPFSLRVQVVATKRQRQVRKTLVVPERTLAALLKEAARKLGLRVESLQTPSGERIASDDDVRALYNGSILHSV